MKRLAFIDANNTAATAKKALGFVIDWHKLCVFLKDSWKCEKIFLYVGVDAEDTQAVQDFASLAALGYVEVSAKPTISYKNPEKEVMVVCPNVSCKKSFVQIFATGYRKKSNCDVELTIGVLDYAAKDTELFVFTADGDFETLFERAVNVGSKIKIVSHQKQYKDTRSGAMASRFSVKLKNLFKKYPNMITPLDLARIRHLIEK